MEIYCVRRILIILQVIEVVVFWVFLTCGGGKESDSVKCFSVSELGTNAQD
jgi:hypothetical protein